MSNPAVYLLAETTIQGKRIQIEDNLGESIHVHIGEFRITFSISEFLKAAESILNAADQILQLKDLSLYKFDLSSLDWDWLSRYDKIQKVEYEERPLNTLYTIQRVYNREELDRIVPLSESRLVQALCGNKEEMLTFKQINLFNVSNEERLFNMLDLIKKAGYPFDNKYIMINQYGRIFDGDHRAACLYHLLGGESTVPVLKITFEGEPSIEDCQEEERKKISIYEQKRFSASPKKAEKAPSRGAEKEDIKPDMDFPCFIEKIQAVGLEYYVVDYKIFSKTGEIIADKLLITGANSTGKIKTIAGQAGSRDAFKKYSLLYGLPSPLVFQFTDSKILVCDRLYCKSMFQNALLPLDQEVNKHGWSKRRENASKGFVEADDCTALVFVVANCVFNLGAFREQDIAFIQKRREMLRSQELLYLLEKVFFQCAGKIVEQLLAQEYDKVTEGYLTNITY